MARMGLAVPPKDHTPAVGLSGLGLQSFGLTADSQEMGLGIMEMG